MYEVEKQCLEDAHCKIQCLVRRNFPYFIDLSEPPIIDASHHYSLAELKAISTGVYKSHAKLCHCTDYRVPLTTLTVPLVVSIHDIFRFTKPDLCYSNDAFSKRFGENRFNEIIQINTLLKTYMTSHKIKYKSPDLEQPSEHAIYYSLMLQWAIATTDFIITPSKFVQDQIVTLFSPTSPVQFVHYGIDHLIETQIFGLPQNFDQDFRQILAQTENVFVYVGQNRKHKNVKTTLEAFAKFIEFNDNLSCYLVLVGTDFVSSSPIAETILQMDIQDKVYLAGYVSDQSLREIYKNATALIHPALHEGFGFTPLEALSCGCEVICTDIPVLRETLGNYAIFVNIDTLDDIIEAFKNAIKNKSDTYLREKRKQLSSEYTWHKFVTELFRIYRYVLTDSSRNKKYARTNN